MGIVPEAEVERLLARNRRARHEYLILEQIEAGIELRGTEIRSLRQGGAQITEAYVRIEHGEAWLHGAHIQPYAFGNRQNHEPGRSRRLLLHRREINRLAGMVRQPGVAVVPLDLHLSHNHVKVGLAVGQGKRTYDKRAALAEREARRQMERAVRREWKTGV